MAAFTGTDPESEITMAENPPAFQKSQKTGIEGLARLYILIMLEIKFSQAGFSLSWFGSPKANIASRYLRRIYGELKESAKKLLMEQKLAAAHGRIIEQGSDLSRDLLRQDALNELLHQRGLKAQQTRLVRIISHELRTPLSLIDSGAQIVSLRADQISSDDLRMRMTKVRDAVQRISILLHKLVDLVTIDTEASETQRVPAAISALVTNIATASVPPTQLQLTMPEGLCANAWVKDGFVVSFALRTALGNAMLCSDTKSPIKVTLKVDASNAVIEVSNCGQIIPEPEIENGGEPYLHGSSTMATGGAGISLHLARELLKQVSGRITIRSQANETALIIHIPVTAQSV